MHLKMTRKFSVRTGLSVAHYVLESQRAKTICLIGLELFLGYVVGKSLVTWYFGGIEGLTVLAIALVIAVKLLRRPVWGLYALAFVAYLLPRGLTIAGLPLSPGLATTCVCLLAALLQICHRRTSVRMSWLWLLLTFMTLFWVSYAFEGASPQTFYRLLAWCQGIAPFVLFSLTVHNEREGRRVLMLWVLAYGLHGMITVLDTAVSGSGLSLVAVARLRTEESAGNANALGWVGLLYLPLSIGLALAATRRWKRWVWWGAFVGITLLLIFGFSRAAMFGMFMTFGLAVLILPSRKERLMMTFLLLVASGGLILSWKVAATHVVGSSRSLTRRSVEDSYAEVSQRLESMWLGWQIFSRNLWFGTGFRSDLPGTHSYFVKIAMEFGIIYLVFSIVLFVYLLRVSFKVARLSQVKQVRNLAWSIFIAGIVAIPESCFGITLTTAGYIQVFWLLLAYLELANREVARQFVQQHQYQRRHFA